MDATYLGKTGRREGDVDGNDLLELCGTLGFQVGDLRARAADIPGRRDSGDELLEIMLEVLDVGDVEEEEVLEALRDTEAEDLVSQCNWDWRETYMTSPGGGSERVSGIEGCCSAHLEYQRDPEEKGK